MAQTDFTPGPASHLQRDNAELIAWLVECPKYHPGEYFALCECGCGRHHWTKDVHAATKFPTKEAAEKARGGDENCIAVEHLFGLALSPQPDTDVVQRARLLAAEIMAAMRQARFPKEYAHEAHDEFEALTLAPMLTAALNASTPEIQRLRDSLDTERYKVAIGVQAVRKALDSRRWLSEAGRGSYTYDDERYQQEFGAALDEIDAALEPLRKIAGDWSDCPTDPLRVAANRAAALKQDEENHDK